MKPKRVIVVDDNTAILDLVKRVLDPFYQVTIIQTAEEALTHLTFLKAMDFIPDLIVIDKVLPRMDGLALAREIKADPTFKNVPLIAMSGFLTDGDKSKVWYGVCDDCVGKDNIGQELLPLVNSYLSKKGELLCIGIPCYI